MSPGRTLSVKTLSIVFTGVITNIRTRMGDLTSNNCASGAALGDKAIHWREVGDKSTNNVTQSTNDSLRSCLYIFQVSMSLIVIAIAEINTAKTGLGQHISN